MFDTVAVNGEVKRLEELRLRDFLQGFQFGAGFFETLRVRRGEAMLLERHLARLGASLAAYADVVRAPPEECLTAGAVREALGRCLGADAALGRDFTGVAKLVAGDGRLLLCFRELPASYALAWREGRALDEVEARTYRRGDTTLNHKSLAYLRQYAHQGRMPLFLNEADEVCETPSANVFVQLGDTLVTPPLGAPCLPGVVRGVLLEAGRVAGRRVVERSLGHSELREARACLLTNATGLAVPVTRLLGRALPESLALAEGARALIESLSSHSGRG